MLSKGDLLVLISNSGETEEIVRLIPALKQLNIDYIAISNNCKSTLVKYAKLYIPIGVQREACPNNLAPTTSTLITLAIVDALAVALIERRNFQQKDFARFYPVGSLGKRILYTVSDLMLTKNVFIPSYTTVRDVIIKMTEAGAGILYIRGSFELIGIITDGDLRRGIDKFDENFFDIKASQMCNKRPLILDHKCTINEVI